MNTRNNVAGDQARRLDEIKENVRGLVERGQERVTAIKGKAVDLQHRAKARGSAALDRTTTIIKEHPLAAVSVAFGLGYLLMRLVRR